MEQDELGDPRSDSAVRAVVRAVARERDRKPTDLPPLYNAIEPDALDGLASRDGDVRVTFEYAGYQVIVSDSDTDTIDVSLE